MLRSSSDSCTFKHRYADMKRGVELNKTIEHVGLWITYYPAIRLMRSTKLNVEDKLYKLQQITLIFFLNSHSGRWSPSWVHSARRPLNGLLYLPRVIMIMENLVEWRLAVETEVLPQRHFVHHKSHLTPTRVWTRAAAVGSQRLTAWAMARPNNARFFF
jgi:hypothetical protein